MFFNLRVLNFHYQYLVVSCFEPNAPQLLDYKNLYHPKVDCYRYLQKLNAFNTLGEEFGLLRWFYFWTSQVLVTELPLVPPFSMTFLLEAVCYCYFDTNCTSYIDTKMRGLIQGFQV